MELTYEDFVNAGKLIRSIPIEVGKGVSVYYEEFVGEIYFKVTIEGKGGEDMKRRTEIISKEMFNNF